MTSWRSIHIMVLPRTTAVMATTSWTPPRPPPLGSKNMPKPPVVITHDPEPSHSPCILEVPCGSDIVASSTTYGSGEPSSRQQGSDPFKGCEGNPHPSKALASAHRRRLRERNLRTADSREINSGGDTC
ncbi:hypothetical protein NL676_023759 [Syzygium grande]|nr:hypothetical protein NL676_023759 [Syzygium grande]